MPVYEVPKINICDVTVTMAPQALDHNEFIDKYMSTLRSAVWRANTQW